MSPSNQRLDLLRRDIDAVDSAIHDLIVKRGTIVEDIRKIKNGAGGPALRPGREAAVLRRLTERHRGAFPLRALLCVWREMMGGMTHMQRPLTAAVYAPEGAERLMGLARDHYGSLTPLNPLPTASACVRAVAEGNADIAVLPLPADGEAESWWRMLMGNDEKTPRVVMRLPFIFEDGGDQALAVASWSRDVSEDEASLLAIRLGGRASRGRIMAGVAAAGFTGGIALASAETEPTNCFHVIEVAGDVSRNDPRLADLGAQLGAESTDIQMIGGYARPLALPEKIA